MKISLPSIFVLATGCMFLSGCGNKPLSRYYSVPQSNIEITPIRNQANNIKTTFEEFKDSSKNNSNDTGPKIVNKHDFIAYNSLFKMLEKKYPPKSEYESTEDYTNRICEACTTEYMVKVDLSNGGRKAYFKYDADRKEVKIKIPSSSHTFSKNGYFDYHSIEVSDIVKNIKERGSYRGTTALGVVANVKVRDLYFDWIDVQYDAYSNLMIEFPCEASDAMKIASGYSIAVKFYINCKRNAGALAIIEKSYSGPTLDSPVDGAFQYRIIPAILKSVIIYDEKNGQVIAFKNY